MEIDTQPAATCTAPVAVFATDGELLMRFQRHRDDQAFAEVVERHGRLVWIVCQQALRHRQDVEDAFQATFLILAQRPLRFARPTPPRRGSTASPSALRLPPGGNARGCAKRR